MNIPGTTLAVSVLLLIAAVSAGAAPQERGELNVLAGTEAAAAGAVLPNYLTRLALEKLQQRELMVAAVDDVDAVAKRQESVRERIHREIGGLPRERTPLNPRTVDVLRRAGYDIEKVIFESQPGLYVTANLYLPRVGTPPFPGILVPLGHESGAKAHEAWQRLLVTFAKNGFVALTYDPIGQGERVQLYDPDFKGSKAGESTKEHTIIGIQCLLTGQNLARYTIWDAMRALDYLQSRKEVDPAKIGCTGNSGGGTMTAYLSALDPRIAAAAPSCYITSWRQLLQTIGPQDAEQCLPPFVLDGLDQSDFVEAFAPKPYLILSAIRDFFPIAGARQSYREARRIYGLLGAEHKLSMFEADDGHGYSLPRRREALRWMNLWLKGAKTEMGPEPEINPEYEDTLWCTTSGQVADSLGGETVFSLNRKRATELIAARKWPLREHEIPDFRAGLRKLVLQLNAVEPPKIIPTVREAGEIRRQGNRIEKLVFESTPGLQVPALLFLPEPRQARLPAVLYVNGEGKARQAQPGGGIERLVKNGNVVLAIDMIGTGETAEPGDSWASAFFRNYDSAMKALLIGRTLVGLRVQDILGALNLLSSRPEVDPARISGVGVGTGTTPLLHAAVIDERFKSLTLEDGLASYESVTNQRIHKNIFESVIPGVLASYDFPGLVASLAPRPAAVIDPRDPQGLPLTMQEATQGYARTIEVFRMAGAGDSFRIVVRRPGQRAY